MAIDPLKIHESRLETTFESDGVVVHTSCETDRAVKRRRVEVKSRWTQIKEIGAGAFGVVCLQENERGDKRAVKGLFRRLMKAQKIDFSRELQALTELREHKQFFVQFFGWYDDKEYIYLAMEYIEHGDLGRYLKEFRPKARAEAAEITSQLLEGLAILHEKRFCHRDLKPQNVLVASISPIWVKIADFGVSKREQGTTLKTRFGTLGYQAPELLGLVKTGRCYTKAVDIWALGCLVYEILTSETPFLARVSGTAWSNDIPDSHNIYSETDMGLLRDYCDGKHRFPAQVLRRSWVSVEGIDFIKSVLLADPSSRLSAREALQSSWIVERHANVLRKGDPSERKEKFLSLGVRNINLELATLLEDQGWGAVLVDFLSLMKLGYGATEDTCGTIFDALLWKPGDQDLRIVRSWTLLQLAAENGHLNVAQLLVDCAADVNAVPAYYIGRTALQAAAGGGYLDIVKLLLDYEADVNAEPAEYDGRTALQAAAEGGHLDVVNLLLDHAAEVNAEPGDDGGRTVLQAAAEEGHLDVVRLLLDRGANVNAEPTGRDGLTALQAAAGEGELDIVELLLEHGADVHAGPAEFEGRTALQAAAEGRHLDIVKLLLDHRAHVNAEPAWHSGRTALQAAAEGGHLDIVRLLLEHEADVHAGPVKYDGRTALQAAAEEGHLDVVRLLLDQGADANAEPAEFEGRTALQAAAEEGHLDVVGLLLDRRADVNAEPAEFEGRTALQAAAEEGHLDVVGLLLDRRADVNAEPAVFEGCTALQAAARMGHKDVIKLLLDHGAM